MRDSYARIEVAVKNVDSREHDILDSDDYYQYHGGMIATVRALTGSEPAAYLGDSSDPSRVVARTLAEETRRVFRARVANPRWIASMIRHGYKGAAELSATVDYLFGYDATAGVAEDWMYEQVAEKLPARRRRREFMSASNPWAARGIAERLLEAADRGMWGEPGRRDAGPGARAVPRARGRARGEPGVSAPRLSRCRRSSARRRWSRRCSSTRSPPRSAACSCAASAARPSRPPCAAWRRCCRRCRGRGRAVRLRPRRARARRRGARRTPRSPSAPRRSSSCRSAPRSTGSSARSTWAARWPASRPSSPGCSPAPTRGSSTSTRSTCCPTTSSTRCSTPPRPAVARVEREAVSVEHDARFLLVGTMNVEEGDLRPQLLDRFGLGVEVGDARRPRGPRRDRPPPARLRARPGGVLRALGATRSARWPQRIADARARLRTVRLPERELLRITGACAKLGVDGVRGDIVSARAARALAALDGAEEVAEEHVRRAAALALAHRRRRDPLDGHMPTAEDLDRALDDEPDPDDARRRARAAAPPPDRRGAIRQARGTAPRRPRPSARRRPPTPRRRTRRARRPRPRNDAAAARPARRRGRLRWPGAGRGPAGRRARTVGRGAGSIDSRPAQAGLATTSRWWPACAPGCSATARTCASTSAPAARARSCAWSSTPAARWAPQRRLARVKGALAGLLRDAYARRDRVAVVAFRDGAAEVLIAPGAPLERAAAALARAAHRRRTPLAAGPGDRRAARAPRGAARPDPALDRRRAHRRPRRRPRRRGPARGRARWAGRRRAVDVVDTEEGPVRLGLAGALAAAAGGRVHRLVPVTTTRRAA